MPARKVPNVRVRITEPLRGSIDGIQLRQFQKDRVYEVGSSLGCYLLSIGAAELVEEESPVLAGPVTALPLARASDTSRRRRKRQK